MVFFSAVFGLLFLTSSSCVLGSAPKGPWDKFNYAPDRVVRPRSITKAVGSVRGEKNLVKSHGSATLSGKGSWVTVDFGIEVGGLISFNFDSVSKSSAIQLTFTESPVYISPQFSDDSSYPWYNQTYDGALPLETPLKKGVWNQPESTLRGGFRYMTIASTDTGSVSISNITCYISFMPHVKDMRDYGGYFYASDPHFHDKDFLTKIWYAGAYTVQTNTVPLHTGRQVPFVSSPGWQNNATLGVAGPIIVDGAKRDRAVWPGDMGVAVPTQFVSTNDLIPTRNALATMFAAINPRTGALPESGPPLSQLDSDTYHAWTLIGTHNYVLYTGDVDWLKVVWTNYTRAVAFLENKVDGTGLMNVTGLRDWARLGGGGHNAEGNALLYKVLVNSAELGTYVNANSLSTAWAANATALKAKFNEAFWLPSAGMYRDNTTTTLCPQDANSMAVLYGLTTSQEQADSISKGLTKNWNKIGAVAPELPDTISPFIGSLELAAHFESGNDDRAMDLLRREWGYMLYTPLSVQSTLLEGYTANGSLGYRSYRGYNYDAAYTSHAHGWSSGPTSALTYYVLGLTVTSPQGRTWSFAPHLSGLTKAEGGFTSPLGWFGAKWSVSKKGKKSKFSATLKVPKGTTGTVKFPLKGSITINGGSVIVVQDASGGVKLDGGDYDIDVEE